MDDTGAEQLIERLTIVGNAPQNKKMMMRNGSLEMETSEWWVLQATSRFIYGDGRLRMTEEIKTLLDRADQILTKAIGDIRNAPLDPSADPRDPSSRLARTLHYTRRLAEALCGATNGLDNLSVTYRNDETVCAKLKSAKQRVGTLVEQARFAIDLAIENNAERGGDPTTKSAARQPHPPHPSHQRQKKRVEGRQRQQHQHTPQPPWHEPHYEAVTSSAPIPISSAGRGRGIRDEFSTEGRSAPSGDGEEEVAGEYGSFQTAMDVHTVRLAETPPSAPTTFWADEEGENGAAPPTMETWVPQFPQDGRLGDGGGDNIIGDDDDDDYV